MPYINSADLTLGRRASWNFEVLPGPSANRGNRYPSALTPRLDFLILQRSK